MARPTGISEPYPYFKSFIALLLIVGCLWAAQWQYHRGVARHHRNFIIEKHVALPDIALSAVTTDPMSNEWRSVIVSGTFDESSQILLRNRYSEGVYGFELLTRFSATAGKTFWVDRGWVKAGATAKVIPVLPQTPQGVVSITGRLRLDSSLPQGAFFAIPTNAGDGLIRKLNAQSGLASENFYLDLLNGSKPSLTPTVAAQLPELTDGPHMAYALQWLFFGGLIGYGRLLIRRQVLPRKEFGI